MGGAEAEQVLLILARNEYVRRRALQSLTRLGSPAVDELALATRDRPDAEQDRARMMAVWWLHQVGSPHLEPLLVEAERD